MAYMNCCERVQACITGQWKTPEEIARIVGINPETVSNYLVKLRKRVAVQKQFVQYKKSSRIYRYGIFKHVDEDIIPETRADQVCQLISNNWKTTWEIAEALGISIKSVLHYLHELKTCKKVEKRIYCWINGGTYYQFRVIA